MADPDLSRLKELLPALSAAMPDLPGAVGDIVDESEVLRHAVDELLARVEETEGEAAEMVRDVDTAMEGVRALAADRRTGIEGQMEALGAEWTAAAADLERTTDDVHDELAAAAGAARSLQGRLEHAGSSAKAVQAEIEGVLEHVRESARTGEGELHSALKAVAARAEALHETVDGARGAISDAVAALAGRMEALRERARMALDEAGGSLSTFGAAQEDHVAGQTVRLFEGTSDLLDALRKGLTDMLVAHVYDAVDDVLDALGVLKHTASDAEGTTKVAREAVESLFETLREEMRPLPDAIEEVRRAADKHLDL